MGDDDGFQEDEIGLIRLHGRRKTRRVRRVPDQDGERKVCGRNRRRRSQGAEHAGDAHHGRPLRRAHAVVRILDDVDALM